MNRIDAEGNFANWVIGAVVGAIAGVVGQVASDVVASLSEGKITVSNWQTYTGAAIGGAVGGAILGGTGNAQVADFATGFVSTAIGLSLEKVTGESDKSWGRIGAQAAIDGGVNLATGNLIKMNKVTAGRNSMAAVYKSGLTKLRNQTASHMSFKVFAKGTFPSVVSGLPMSIYSGSSIISRAFE